MFEKCAIFDSFLDPPGGLKSFKKHGFSMVLAKNASSQIAFEGSVKKSIFRSPGGAWEPKGEFHRPSMTYPAASPVAVALISREFLKDEVPEGGGVSAAPPLLCVGLGLFGTDEEVMSVLATMELVPLSPVT